MNPLKGQTESKTYSDITWHKVTELDLTFTKAIRSTRGALHIM